MGRDRLYLFALPTSRTCLPRTLPATQSRMRKEFKRGKPSSFCPFRTFRTSEKYIVLFCYFSDRRKVHGAFLLLFGQAKSTPVYCYFPYGVITRYSFKKRKAGHPAFWIFIRFIRPRCGLQTCSRNSFRHSFPAKHAEHRSAHPMATLP